MKKIMLTSRLIIVGLFILMVSLSGTTIINSNAVKGEKPDSRSILQPAIDFGRIPLYFIANQGQVSQQAQFYARTSRYTLWITKKGFVFDSFKKKGKSFTRDVSGMNFINANKNPGMSAIDKAKLKVNYFKGDDKSKWNCNVATSKAIQYKNLYPHIDLKVYGIEKQIEYDWIVNTGGNAGAIRFQYKNVKASHIDEAGNLVIETGFGKLMHKRPVSYQHKNNKKIMVNARFKQIAANTYGFEVGEYDRALTLIIDPVVLAYSTYLGGNGDDMGRDIVVDSLGNVYVTGWTNSADFPALDSYQTDSPDKDVFVTKLATMESGTAGLLYSTYLGGNSDDRGNGIAVDAVGNVYVSGYTSSTDFPTRNQYQGDQPSTDVFVTKLDTNINGAGGLLYSTYLGGDGMDVGLSIAADAGGNVYLTGETGSTDFPNQNQYQANQPDVDSFVTKLDTTKSGNSCLIYSTYLGGGDIDVGNGVAVDGSGYIYVTGWTLSDNFPAHNEFQAEPAGSTDVFVAKIDPFAGYSDSLLYSTYLGSPGPDSGNDIAVDSSGYTYVTGSAGDSEFPVLNLYQTYQGFGDAFVVKMDLDDYGENSLLYSTFLGGSLVDVAHGITVDSAANVYVTGYTGSSDFPRLSQYQSNQALDDVFVSKLDLTRSGTDCLLYSTYLGGGDYDYGRGIAVDGSGNIYVTGYIYSTDFPTRNQYQAEPGDGLMDAFVSKLAAAVLPSVTTGAVSAITTTSAQCDGNVTFDGGVDVTARGLCWSTTANPDVSDSHTTDGTGTGSYSGSVTGLTAGTLYYVRAYATNSLGTAYGSDVTFTSTALTTPSVTTSAVSNITSSSAQSGGEVVSDGGSAVTARGLCWSTAVNPDINDSHTVDGSGSGSFSGSVSGLNSGVTYYVRAYATNSVGTSYGSDVSFKTSAALPSVTTTAVSNITTGTAESGGTITANGGGSIIGRGLCWNTSGTPTAKDYVTFDGVGNGSFNSALTGLAENTTYYVRAYASNSAGTAYGNEISFTTAAETVGITITEPNDNDSVSGTITIKATTNSQADLIQSVGKVEFFIDGEKIAEDSAEPYQATWDTTSYNDGSHIIKALAYNAINDTSQDEITVQVGNIPPELLINRSRLNYGSDSGDAAGLTTGAQKIYINNVGGGTLNWTAKVSDGAQWLNCTPASGTGGGAVTVSVDASTLASGSYSSSITIQAPNALNSPQTVAVTLTVYSAATTSKPFGYFETPIHGSTVRSSIPVTGWVLDDIDIKSVKIYRAPIAGHEEQEIGGTINLIYIGDAVTVDGARPDVEEKFPTYPKEYQAGFGYMLLTNTLPPEANGTFTLYARAVDLEGNEVTLGSKKIFTDNVSAVKPFGAIDSPVQAGNISGNSYLNFGWALTPQPNTIPFDGSSIILWVDGVPLSNKAVYNLYREDIAARFPGYNNSNGAVGYFQLDTTAYLNGVHTIAWSVEDSAGNRDGIGSRYFTILNTGINRTARSSTVRGKRISPLLVKQMPLSREPVSVKLGYDINAKAGVLLQDKKGIVTIRSKETGRIEVHLGGSRSKTRAGSGYMIKGDGLYPLPIGSFLDHDKHIFYWQPCAGFYGIYRFVFIEKMPDGKMTRKMVNVEISAK